jgi:hypothetical protein
MSHEARAMPGGATGLYLFLLGSAAVFLSLIILVLSGFGDAAFGSAGWIIPVWGGGAVALAVGLRKRGGALVSSVSRLWLGFGLVGLAIIIFGTDVSFA